MAGRRYFYLFIGPFRYSVHRYCTFDQLATRSLETSVRLW